MRRRKFLALAGAAVAVRPGAGQAQSAAKPLIGFLSSASTAFMANFTPSVRQGLEETGYIEGKDFAFEYRGADGQYEKLPDLAASLVARKVAVIVAAGGTDPAKAAKAATTAIPIVFISAADPVKAGLVASLSRPEGNVTGISLIGSSLEAKRLEILDRLVAPGAPIGVLVNPGYPAAAEQARELQAAAAGLRRPILVQHAGTEGEIESGFAAIAQGGARGVLVAQDQFYNSHNAQIVALAARYKLPGIYNERQYADHGGLITYGTNFFEGYRQAGVMIGKILKGARPADLPVLQPTTFELVINMKTAKALGVAIPPSLLSTADEVIE